jgi:hypothetical protein
MSNVSRQMQRDATLSYSEPLIRSAVLAFWRRTLGLGFFVALLTVAVGLVVLRVQGAAGWVLGAVGAVLVMGALFMVALYFVHYRRALHTFRKMGGHAATFRAEDSSFTFSSAIGSTTLRWSAVAELWQFSNVWLLLYSKAQFSTLPVACVSHELLAFVRERVQAAGGKVDG